MGEKCAIVGLGYVGCVTAACLARLGHRVIGVDNDGYKVETVLAGRAPFFEPGLEELVKSGIASGGLTATTDLPAAIKQSDIALICVGTPSERNGSPSLEQLRRVCSEIADCLRGRARRLIVSVRSTVLPGTCEAVVGTALAAGGQVAIVSNPEFLREGGAVRDFMEPSLVVVGGEDPGAVERVAGLYAPRGVEPVRVSLRSAELIKYACNSFHALKVAFANEIGALGAVMGIDAAEVMDTLCRDVRLNISPAYLKPGFAFGGSCLPKDLRALVHRASRLDLQLPLLESILLSNRQHLERAVQAVCDLPVDRIGVFGLTFKENTDDLRESPVVALLERLIGKGRNVRVFDPQIQLDRIYGSNQRFLLAAIPHISRLLDAAFEDTLKWAQHLVVAQKPSEPFADAIRRSGIPVLDLAGAFPDLARAERLTRGAA